MNGKQIRIGVTGHRNLRAADEEQLKEKVREVLRALKEKYDSQNVELWLMAAMAEGADLLSVQVAREEGLKILATLPMDVEELRKDFENSEKRWQEQFDEALKNANQILVVPDMEQTEFSRNLGENGNKYLSDMVVATNQLAYNKQSDATIKRSDVTSRDYHYRQASIYVAAKADYLIALWDGKPGRPGGCGTAETVEFFKTGYFSEKKETRRDALYDIRVTRREEK